MQARYKWLLLPPAIALVLFMGPLRRVGLPSAGTELAQQTEGEVGRGIVPMPDAWQVTSTLLGVLLLGGAGIMLLARLRRGSSPRSGDLMSLRQSLRLSARHSVHAVQFDNSLLLLGECDNSLCLIKLGRDPEQLEDEERLAAREADEEEGAVPRDMVIPRPGVPTTKLLRPPETPRAGRSRPSLDEFKDLLRRVKAGSRR